MIHRLTKEEIEQLPLVQFNDRIVLVDTADKLDRAIAEMRQERILGFDTETRPSFKRGVTYGTALLQLATPFAAWLIRVGQLGVNASLAELLADESILKVGVAIRDDIKGLQRCRRFVPGNFIDLQDLARDAGYEDFSLKKMAAHVMGVRISKRQRLSNWEAPTLTQAQQRYAATDAWVSLMIYKGMMNGIKEHDRVREILSRMAQNETE
ncbi:MAG: 3'-5' exonuclease domain-containing protein 2 [Bacteroidales bacterium]|nr:3'-5' exonuclease domain-containing protein 2 [Bacteroidales bacterium]